VVRSEAMMDERESMVDLQVRSRGLLLGAAVGDALGWPQEQRSGIVGGARSRDVKAQAAFREWQRNSGTQFGRYVESVAPGEYSDDTQLLLAVARACNHGDSWFEHLTGVELPAWLAYQRGGGRAVLMAARAWLHGHEPWVSGSKQVDPARYFAAGANGVAMRVAPHALACSGRDAEDLVARVINDGIATHGHPRALVGGALHALTLWFLLRQSTTLSYGELVEHLRRESAWRQVDLAHVVPPGWLEAYRQRMEQPAQEAWNATVDEVDRLLDVASKGLRRGALADDQATLDELGCFDSKTNGAGTVSAVAALYLSARSAARPLSGLLAAAFLKNADTDTLASMVGSSLGALHGSDWLGDLAATVQDAAYLEKFAVKGLSAAVPAQTDLFSAEALGTRTHAHHVSSREMTRFNRILDREADLEGTFIDGRGFSVEARLELESKTKASVTRYRLRLSDGQTIVVDRLRRRVRDVREPTRGSSAELTRRATSEVRRVTILVRDLSVMANFYRNVLGLPVHGRGDGVVDVGPHLRLRSDPSLPPVPGGLVVEVVAHDLSRIRTVLDGAGAEDSGVIHTTDPEGNRILVRSRRP
jgi:ADP-ribosylglycohydrolase